MSTERAREWPDTSREDHDLIVAIAERAERELPAGALPRRMTLVMDLTAAHGHIPIRLSDLLAAPLGDFAHDVGGIVRHIDRERLELGGCFVPRYSA